MPEDKAPALKEIFNRERIDHIARELSIVHSNSDAGKFKKLAVKNLDEHSLMERLHQVAEALRQVLPDDSERASKILCALAPRINHGFVTMALGECITLYGDADINQAAITLRTLTKYGSSEFAVRHLLQRDPSRMIKIMESWASDRDEHVRRLASEGSRPRLPWAQKISALTKIPPPTAKILSILMADSSLYVRKSVANHLNDITKIDPGWVADFLEQFSIEKPETAWIAKHALRGLIKKGNVRALSLMGVRGEASITVQNLQITPAVAKLGNSITLSVQLSSTSISTQKLVVDYAIHYVKKTGALSPKVFKLKTFHLEPNETVTLSRTQTIDNFTTRTHYAGKHVVDILVNGVCVGKTAFALKI